MHSHPSLRRVRRAGLAVAVAGMAATAFAVPSHADDGGGRIVGGGPANSGEYPYFVALLRTDVGGSPFDRQFCGGSLIAPDTVLTAAHCIVLPASSIEVAIGRTDLDDASTGEVIAVTEAVVHPDFVSVEGGDDVALLRLESSSSAPTVSLAGPAEASLTRAGRPATVIGHGTTSSGGSGSPSLLEVSVPIQRDSYMARQYNSVGEPYDATTMVGAGPQAGGQDSCQGDSGGPLLVFGPNGPRQMGIVSWGVGCAAAGLPGIYSEIYRGPLQEWVFANL
jgi:secreted trypsin-like serine protease